MKTKLNRWLLSGIMWLLLASAVPVHAFYNPSTGRWLSRDPIGEAGGVSLTAFAYNDLVNLVDPLGLWTRDGWSGGWGSYQGTATAECGDTLSELARLITGRASDWKALGTSPAIKAGQKVKIAPLLVVLEDRMRGNVVSATKSFNATFGLPVPPFQGSGSAEVNRFFGSGAIQCDCTVAAYIVIAKGLLDTIGATDFDALGYPLKLVTTKGHLFVRWEDARERFNIEAAGQGVNRFSDDYYRHWPLEVSAEEILTDGNLKSLSSAGELAVFQSIRGMCLKEARRYGDAADSFREAARLAPDCRSYALMQSQMEGMAGRTRTTTIALTAKGEQHP